MLCVAGDTVANVDQTSRKKKATTKVVDTDQSQRKGENRKRRRTEPAPPLRCVCNNKEEEEASIGNLGLRDDLILFSSSSVFTDITDEDTRNIWLRFLMAFARAIPVVVVWILPLVLPPSLSLSPAAFPSLSALVDIVSATARKEGKKER